MAAGGTGEPTRDRAQTAQDFALGISFFVVAVAFVFAFVPSMLAFTTADPGAKAAKQADMASSGLIRDLAAAGGEPGRMNGTATADYFNTTDSEAALQADLGLPEIAYINVTMRTIDGEDVLNTTGSNGNEIRLAAGREYDETRPAAEVSRVVTMTGDDCEPACQLVVRVW